MEWYCNLRSIFIPPGEFKGISIAEPKATSKYTVEELEATQMVGVYVDENINPEDNLYFWNKQSEWEHTPGREVREICINEMMEDSPQKE
jgi:hypothetical protein